MLSTVQATVHPPTIPDPTPGLQVPVGNQCPTCGILRDFWIYNPFMPGGTNGWRIRRTQLCDCTEPRPPADRPDPELVALDHLLHREGHRHQTFATFRPHGRPRSLAAYRFCADYARRAATSAGVCLWGTPSPAREHLLAALVNAARAGGQATALIGFAHALELLAPPADVEAFRPARLALRRVPVLAISGLFADPATPVELKPLHQLLDDRARNARTTHVTLHRPPAAWRAAARAEDHPIQAEIALLIERLTLAPIAVPA